MENDEKRQNEQLYIISIMTKQAESLYLCDLLELKKVLYPNKYPNLYFKAPDDCYREGLLW